MGKIKHELWTFAKAEMSASVSSCVDFGLAVSLTFLELFTYGYANIIGVVCGGLTNFTLNCQYVFSHTGRGKKSLAERACGRHPLFCDRKMSRSLGSSVWFQLSAAAGLGIQA